MTPFSIIIVLSLVFLPFTSHAEDLDKGPLELITAAEAAAPDLPSSESYIEISREGDDGPIIELNAPQIGNPAKSPLTIDVTFLQNKGKDIDLSTFKAEYLKFITIDLTSRIKPYVTKDGIHTKDTKLPSGTHSIRITIGDKSGAITKRVFTVEVL